jgi:hypothetical protein
MNPYGAAILEMVGVFMVPILGLLVLILIIGEERG